MVLSCVPASVLGALLLATHGNSAPHGSNANQPGIISIPVVVSESDPIAPADIVKRTVKADLNTARYELATMMKLKAAPGDQELNLQVDTGSVVTWTNPDCSTAGAHEAFCRTLNRYEPDGKAVPQKIDPIYYGKGAATVDMYSTNIKLGDVEVDQFPLGVATATKDLSMGVLGLGPPKADQEKYSLVSQLAAQKHIASRAFSIDIGHKANVHPAAAERGSVIFGGVDRQKFSGTLQTVKMLDFDGNIPLYRVPLDSLTVRMREHSESFHKLKVSLDTGSSYLLLPPEITNAIVETYSAKEGNNGILWVPCAYRDDGEGGIKYRFGKTTIVTPLKDLIGLPLPEKKGWCHMRVAKTTPNRMVLGLPFFRAAYTVFDRDNHEFHVAKAADCGSTLEKIDEGPNGVPLEGQC